MYSACRLRYNELFDMAHSEPEGMSMMVKPEEVGLSSQRLERIRPHLQRYIDAGKVAGTLILVARQGHIAYFEPQGHLELERRRPMQRDTMGNPNIYLLGEFVPFLMWRCTTCCAP
jgi:hypothetical protein